jgi:Flp pilus assembly protein TadG
MTIQTGLPRRFPTRPVGLLRDARGLVAIEFALVFPAMLVMLMGMYDASAGMIAYRRVTDAAETAAVMATELSVQLSNNGTTCFSAPCTSLTPAQAKQASSAIYGMMPNLYSQAGAVFSVTMSAISYNVSPKNCVPSGTTTCSYTPNVAWSVVLSYGSTSINGVPVNRPCGSPIQVAQTATPTRNTVPTLGMSPLSSILIVDVAYVYNPLFSYVFTGPITFKHSAFLPSRIAVATPTLSNQPANTSTFSFIQYDVNNTSTSDSNICPGYGCMASAGAGNNTCS